MHSRVLVIGDEPLRQFDAAIGRIGDWLANADWRAIGGRFTGSLPVTPGASTAKVYGRTMPSLEAHIGMGLAGQGWDYEQGDAAGEGVDQARLDEVDHGRLAQVWLHGVIVNGAWHGPGDGIGLIEPADVAALLRTAPASALATIVDCHS